MRKKMFVLLGIVFFGVFLFYACQHEDLENPPEKQVDNTVESMLKGINNPDIREAIMWYGKNWPLSSGARGTNGEHPLFDNMLPRWPFAFARKSEEGLTSVEVPLQTHSSIAFALPENAIAYDETKNSMYIQSLTRLVVLTDKSKGTTRGFFMTLVPSKKFMDAKKFNVYRSNYFRREKDFDGYIYFHELDGSFANGWRYEDGVITHIVLDKASEASLSRAGHYENYLVCTPRYRRVCTGHYETMEGGTSVYVEDNCYYERTTDECHYEKRWVEDGGGGYDPDQKPKCPYKTPGCPGGDKCTCCAICKGPCTSAVCPKCGKTHCKVVHLDCEEVNDAAKVLTQKLFDDMGQVVQSGNGTMTLNDFEAKVLQDPTKEHGIVLNKKYDSTLGEYNGYVLKNYAVGNNDNVTTVLEVQTEANIHTHPNSVTPGYVHVMPPSAADLKALVSAGENFSYYKTSYVFAGDDKFALTITDRAKAKVFLQNNPNFVGARNEFDMNSDVGKVYYEAQSALKAKYGEGIERDAYALAYALQQADAGVQLSWKKKGDSQFIVYTLKKVRNGNDFEFFVFKCL